MSQTVLEKIVVQRSRRLEEVQWDAIGSELSDRSMRQSIADSATGIIFECKARSPSRGLLSDNYQPGTIAKAYEPFAAGISVLTEPDFFSGEYQHLQQVRAAVETPLLAKDFVIDIRQVLHARQHGADCILLMLSVIDDVFWKAAYDEATRLGLDVLTEVHNEAELQRAIDLKAPIIGINNRDLHSLTTDLNVSRRLAPMIPEDRIIISESGIASYQDLQSLSPLVHGFLIGTSMMQSADTQQAVRALIHSEVKVCGLTNLADAQHAYASGAAWGGVIFTPRSKRFITSEQLSVWSQQTELPLVGVFMDQSIDEIVAAVQANPLKVVQLHGGESPAFVTELKRKLGTEIAVWKAISASDTDSAYPSSADLEALTTEWLGVGVSKVLVDTPKSPGPHSLDYSQIISNPDVMLAGSLDIDSELLLSPGRQAGLDICSALEQAPGQKDHNKITTLFKKLEVKTRNE